MLFTAVLFILFMGKRKQRIIPVIEPVRNTTLDFVQTIGRLYFNRHDNKNLAIKKITFFMDYLRNRFFIRNADDAGLINQLSLKSGISEIELQSLFNTINHARNCKVLSDHDLMILNNKIDEFYKNTSIA